MTGTLAPQKQALWIRCVVLITAVGAFHLPEDISCPKGGQIHLPSRRCYWLSEMTSSWFEAQDSCRETQGGDLASAHSLELQNLIHYSFPVKTTVWVWLKGSGGDGSDQVGDVEPVSPAWWAGGSESQGGCTQMALGTQGRWRKTQCAGRYLFLCEKEVTESLPSVDSYLIGLVLMTGIYAQTQIHPFPNVPDIGQLTVEMQLFPGMWFSHAGQLVSVELVVQPSPVSSLARVQILRPYCNPNHHLVPPGCSSLLNPFTCCSAVPLCNTTGGCSMGQYWCHLLEACVSHTAPCSPYDSAARGRGFALPPRYPAIPPFYHLVADLPLRLNPSSELKTISLLLPDRAIMVYPDDIVAIQHTRNSGTFLHCLNSEASLNSPWRQSYMSLRGMEWGGWWEGGLTSLPQRGQWVDGVVCDLRMLYMDNLHTGTEHDDNFGFTHRETTTAPDIWALTTGLTPSLRSEYGLDVIHPLPDEKNQIHVQINVPTLIVVKVLFGEKARSSWSGPVLQTGVPFLPSCPEEVAQSWPGCKRQSHDAWFSSVTVELPSVGVQTLNISVMDIVGSQSVSVRVCGYEAVKGLSIEPHGCLRMLVETPQSFIAKVESGSSVKFTWVIDNLETFAHEGESYSVVFKKPAEYKLRVTASNPVSSQSQQILLTADEMTPLAGPEFLLVREVVAVDATHLYTLRVKVDISLPVTFRWDFGDGSSKVIHTKSAPCQNMERLMARGEKQVYIHDSVNYTYSISDDYTLHVQVSNQYDNTDASMKISARPQLNHLLISSSLPMPLVKQTLLLEASAEPSSYAVIYTWDFGDGSEAVQGIHRKVSHTFTSAGVYNITVCANNTLAVLTTWLMLEVMEKISGLMFNYNGPSELSSVTDFRATVATGTSLMWNFVFGDGSLQGNLTNGSISHIYKSPGNYTVSLTVSNSVSQAHQSISVEVYRLTISGVLPTECHMSERDIQLTALVNGNISKMTFHWLFGDGSPLTVVRGQSTVMHKYQSPGIFHISLTVFSSVTSVLFNTSICVEAPITNMTVQSSQEVVAVGEEVCFRVLVSPERMIGYQFKWFRRPSSLIAMTENAQKCFSFKEEGVEEVSVTASNKVNNKTAKASITIQNPVSELSVAHDSQNDTLMVNTLASFWVASCTGSNVSVLWDFGDGSPVEQKQNVSHVFTSTGQFTVTTTAFNAVSRDSVTIKVNVLLPVSDLSLHTNQPYAVVGEETLISAISSAISSSNYYWTVDGVTSTKQGTYQFRFAFLKPGVYQVRVIAQNLLIRKEAAILIEVFERIEGLQIECQNLTNMKYIPTQEELPFIASITKGSNVTYHWLATQSEINRQITGDGELFHMLAEAPGGISVQLRAFNKLGEVTSIVSLVAVQRVTSPHITTQSSIVALGKVVNISVSVVTGSDLQYLWYMKSDLSPLRTHAPFLLHTFTSLGNCLLKVSVQNVLSHSNVTKDFNVQEEVQEVDFEIEGKMHPFYITTSAAVPFHGLIRKGSDLHWNWKVRDVKTMLFNASNQTFVYIFPHAGIYQVFLNVSNGINWQMVSHSVTVQDAIKSLMLNISKSSFCTEEQVSFIPTISKGSNVSFVITFRSKDWIHSQGILEGRFTTSSLPAGTHLVTVKAWNQVSSAKVSSSILVIEHIQGLRLLNCCSVPLEALKGIQFKAEIRSGLPVNYTWIFHLVGSEPTWLMGQEVIFTSPESGLLSVSVLATNGVCSKTLNDTATVQWPVKKVKLVCHSERIFVGHSVTFSAKANGGSNLRYLWDFGDSTEALVTDLSTVNHTYYTPGKYSVMVKVLNSVSHVSTQLHMEVEEPQCSSPQASLVQSHSTIFRSRPSFFEANVDINCSAYKTTYLWEILKESDCTNAKLKLSGNKVILRSQVDATSTFLLLPKHTLDMGQYFLVFTVSLQGTPLLVQRKTSVTVVHSPLVAVIKGGSHRLWPSLSDLILDGSESQDPDVEPGVEDTLQYHWTFMTVNSTESHFVKQLIGSSSSRMIVLSTQLHSGTVYVFTLTVHKAGRRPASVNQTVTVCEAPVLPVTVECVSCSVLSSPHHISYTTPIILSGQCGQCDDQAQYKWNAEDQTGMTLHLNKVATSTGRHSPNLVVRSGVLQPGQSYTFTLNVSQPGRGQWGSASLTILPNNPPRGGLCDLSPESDIRLLETVVTYNCSGWQDDESRASQLIYTFQVASCQTIGMMCPLLTLYRGTRSTFGSLVPMGSPGHERGMSVITVTLLIEDHLGAKVIALNRMLTVENPARDEVASQWLRKKSQTELWALVQHGNPQEIIPYSIALTSQLNQMESGQTARELMDRREIRENVTQALASLPMSSLLDVDQISSALSQSTAVSSELVCENCQEKVLEAVGKMIHIMKEQMSPGVLSAVEIGRNILNIIGSTLAAVSESVSASSSHPAYSGTLHASTVARSALGHAGALMRSLMHARVHGEAPLSLSTPYINTVGFQGDPSDLLCTHQSNQNQIIPSQSSSTDQSKSSHCQFHIPASLTAHLKSQKSEVVQVLFGMDAELGSNPLLTAANPPISTTLVAMELTTPQGQPIPIQDLDPEQAIQVTLPNKYPLGQDDGGGDGRVGEAGNGTCLTVTLPMEGRLNLTVKAVDGLDKNAGLYISFNFSLDPGTTPVSLGHVKIEVSSTVPGTNASQNSLVKKWALTLSASTTSTEETIFLSPLLNGTDKPLSVSLTSSLVDSGPVHVSACVFSSLCQYYSVKQRRWSSEGLQPLEGSTLHAAHCLTQHLTMFGASLFVHPGAVVLLSPSGGPMRNMVVGIVCAVLVLIHLLVGLIAHKLDHLDSLRLSQVPLCGRPGLYHYRVLVKTGWRQGAGQPRTSQHDVEVKSTTAHVGISLYGVNKSGSRHLQRDGAFQRGSLDQFHLETDDNLGEVWKIRIWHDNTGLDPSWYIQHVVVWDPQTDHMFFFQLEDWLSVENQKNGSVEKEVLASCPEELSQFRRVFTSQLMFGMVEHHLWLSLWERPAHSRFTRGQRVTCSALMLHLYLALGALWYGAVGAEGHSGPVSAQLLVYAETVAAGMTIAVLVFPLQCFLCFLFRKTHSQVTVDISVPPSPVCHSVEMDVYLGQSKLSGPSFLSLPDSTVPVRDSPSSLLESKAFDSSILDFWAASGLAPQTHGACQREGVGTWPSCNSLLNLPVGPYLTKMTPAPNLCKASPALGPIRQLRRKKALMQLRLASPSSTGSSSALLSPFCTYPLSKDISSSHQSPAAPGQKVSTRNTNLVQAHNHNLTTLLTLSEEDLLMSIAAAAEDTADISNSNSDSGRDSPRTTSSLSTTSWSEQSDDKSLYGAESHKPDPQSCPSHYGAGLYKCPSVLSVDSVASTFLPSPSPDSTRSSSTTRIGVARGQPSWLLPPWALCVIYPLVALLLGACLTVVGLYGSFLSRTVVLMWLVSALSAFLTSALLLEPLKVCVQALIYTALWRPVDPEVEDQLAQETTVVRAFGEHGGKVRPPCGYGLLQAKEEARKVRALRSLMRHCVCQLLFLLLVLMVNYQDSVEQRQGRLLHSAVRRRLHTAPLGVPNLTSLRDWSDAEQWINHTLVPHLHQNPTLRLVGLPRLQYTHTLSPLAGVFLGNSSVTTHQLLAELHIADWCKKQFKTLSVGFTHYHRESGLFVCVSIQLEWAQTQGVTPFLSICPLLLPSSFSGQELQVALAVLLLISALLILFGELWSLATERAQYLRQCRHWFQLLLALLSLATAILQLCFLSQATLCVSKLRSQPDNFVNFHSAALLAQRYSQCAAVLLTLLVLKLLGTLRFVRRWVGLGRVLQRAWREMWTLTVLLLLLLLLCTHLGNTLFSRSVEGFLSVHQTGVSVLSILRGRRALQRLCRVHPVLGPLYGLLLMGGSVWLLARLCGAFLIRTYRYTMAEQAELYRPTIEPQDYEMVEFFIKRLKLWMGLTKAKEFRHRVKFEGMDIPPSRSSQESCLSTLSSTLPSTHSPSLSSSFSSPRPLSSALSMRSEDSSVPEPGFDVQPYLDCLLPCVSALLSRFDQVNQITEDIHNLEMKLEEAQTRRRKMWISNENKGAERFGKSAKPKELVREERETAEVRHRKTGLLYPKPRVSLPSLFSLTPSALQYSAASIYIFPRTHSTYSESESVPFQPQASSDNHTSEAAKLASGICGLYPAGSPGFDRFPRRRAWHSGSSHSADAAQRIFLTQGMGPCGNGGEHLAFNKTRPRSEEGVRRHISDGVPVKRKAWISEGSETEQD
ncbi:polycystin-1 isoform X2 [Siniperca chuatsi]|uniref:polycystin-1 isoform X2 n=1 Tax=Siniperca chuatsi TaxID=119488 RepID=UPI001CE17988|nr:polycystin-1 isoform X2 [Siniperca chuatsi]